MRQSSRMIRVALLVLMAGMGGAGATELRPTDRSLLLRPGITLDLPVLESRQRRREFQLQQQQFREDDRMSVSRPQQPLDIPYMQPNCRVQVSGDNISRSCR